MSQRAPDDAASAGSPISPAAIKVHLRHVYEKLGVESRVEAVAEAMRTGLVEAP